MRTNKVFLITFATPNFYYSRNTLIKSARSAGIQYIKSFTIKEFQRTDFYKQNVNIAKQQRGAGYWLWKPYYILQILNELDDEDVLIYCDAGVDIIESVQPLIQLAENSRDGIILFENFQGSAYFNRTAGLELNEYNLYTELNKNKYWTKRDAFILMGLDAEHYWSAPQVNANLQLYKKNESALAFVKEWLHYCCNEQIITDMLNKSGLNNFDNFIAHIHDQAIISLLAEKYMIELFRCPSQFGNHFKSKEFRQEGEFLLLPYSDSPKLNSKYGTLTNHHRTRFPNLLQRWKMFLAQERKIFMNKYFLA